MKCVITFEALSPITHGGENAGNEMLVRREPVSTPLGVRHVPVITGNSLRHRLFRQQFAEAIVSDGWQCSKEQLRWLFNGGALDGKHPNVDVRRIERARSLMPHIELLGCSMADQIVAGKLDMGIAWIACQETQSIIRDSVPGGWCDDATLAPSHEFMARNQYYRHDAVRQMSNHVAGDDVGDDYAGMPHGGEHVIPGAIFIAAMHADGLSPLGRSAVVWAIRRWAAGGATVGGQSSRGHGVVKPSLWTDGDDDPELFAEHLDENLDEMRAFVSTLYTKAAA